MFHLQSEHFGVCSNGEASNPWVHFIRKSFKSSGFLLKHHTHPGLWKKLRTHSNNLDICNMRRGCKCRLKSRNNLQNSCKILGLPKRPKIIRHASVIYIYIFFLPCRFDRCGPCTVPRPLWLSCWAHWRRSRSPPWTLSRTGLWRRQQTGDLSDEIKTRPVRFCHFHVFKTPPSLSSIIS